MSELADQLRRRRAASWRLPCLVDGRRDPIDPDRGRAVITVRVISGQTLEFTGCDRAVFKAIKDVGAVYQRAPRGGAWLVRGDLGDDVEALLTSRGYTVQAAF